ncbi:MAG: cytochrome C oxidase subunit IV family protein [Akkermansiaceae bacterium]
MNTHITFAILIVLTITAALSANNQSAGWLIISLALVKLLLVAFLFMDLRKAHLFWKTSVVFFSLIFLTIVAILMH